MRTSRWRRTIFVRESSRPRYLGRHSLYVWLGNQRATELLIASRNTLAGLVNGQTRRYDAMVISFANRPLFFTVLKWLITWLIYNASWITHQINLKILLNVPSWCVPLKQTRFDILPMDNNTVFFICSFYSSFLSIIYLISKNLCCIINRSYTIDNNIYLFKLYLHSAQ